MSHNKNSRVIRVLNAKEQLELRIVNNKERLEVLAQIIVNTHQRLHYSNTWWRCSRHLKHSFTLLMELVHSKIHRIELLVTGVFKNNSGIKLLPIGECQKVKRPYDGENNEQYKRDYIDEMLYSHNHDCHCVTKRFIERRREERENRLWNSNSF